MNPEVQLTAALAAIDKAAAKSSDSRLVAAKCRGLMHGYHARWKDAGYESLAVEVVIHKNLTNPATWRSSRTFTLAGKLDVIAHYAGRTVIVDHKTTSEDIADPNATYWQQLAVEGQVNQYMLLAWMDGCKADNALWDVIRKPDIRPRKMTKAERGHVVATGKWFEREVSDDERQEIAAGGDTESLAMYEGRLAHDCTVERPERYFQRRMVPRLDGEIIEYAAEVWEHSQEMIAAAQRAKETQRLPPRNSGACLLYGSPCSFLGICSGHDTPDSERWQRKAEVHRELDSAVGEGRDVLTNSRIRCFQTCRRKEFYQYQLGIERVREEEKESLFFGTCFHSGMRAWWEHLLVSPQENPYVNRCNDSAVDEIAESAAQP